MPRSVTPFLMFDNNAAQAIQLYTTVFDNAELIKLQHYGADEGGVEGGVKLAEIRIGTQHLYCIDSPVHHNFSFTPAMSLFIECDSEEELYFLAQQLAEQGEYLMPVGDYGFSSLFCWFDDRFGVSWQLNLR